MESFSKRREISVALLYASAYGNTATLAQAIALGLTKGGVAVKSINCEFATPDEIRTAVEQVRWFSHWFSYHWWSCTYPYSYSFGYCPDKLVITLNLQGYLVPMAGVAKPLT